MVLFWISTSSLRYRFGERAPSKEPIFPSVTLDIRSELVLLESLTDLFDATGEKKTHFLSRRIQDIPALCLHDAMGHFGDSQQNKPKMAIRIKASAGQKSCRAIGFSIPSSHSPCDFSLVQEVWQRARWHGQSSIFVILLILPRNNPTRILCIFMWQRNKIR